MKTPIKFCVLSVALCVFELPLAFADPSISSATIIPISVSSAVATMPPWLTMLHPTENQKLPALTQVFAYGQVTPGSTLTINGTMVAVHPKGAYLTMVPLTSGENTLKAEVTSTTGVATLERRVSVNPGWVMSRSTPPLIERASVTPADAMLLTVGDTVRVTFQGSPGGKAEFSIEPKIRHIPMVEIGAGSTTARGIYQGSYVVRSGDDVSRAVIEVSLKNGARTVREKAQGRLTIEHTDFPRIGVITDEAVAVRTGPEAGYDLFLYKDMKIRLTGKIGAQQRVRLSSLQSGWIKESAVRELPAGTLAPQSTLGTITTSRQSESTLIRTTLSEALAYRVEQTLDPMQLTVTLYGAVAKVDLMKYDPSDTLIRQVRWRQLAPDVVQLIIEPTFKTWWGYDVRYEGSTFTVEIREPWKHADFKGMPIAIDAGHGGTDAGAMGGLGTLEKNTNLAIAKVVQETLTQAGAKAFLIRDADIDVALQDRGKLAWKAGARLFISIHGNSAGAMGNPIWNNGFSIYFYHPQSKALAQSIHGQYRRLLSPLPDHGLYYADLAVCRMTQMPSILTEQAFLIVPDQEQLLLEPKFHKSVATAIMNGIRDFLKR